jgi:hypothetical protein
MTSLIQVVKRYRAHQGLRTLRSDDFTETSVEIVAGRLGDGHASKMPDVSRVPVAGLARL